VHFRRGGARDAQRRLPLAPSLEALAREATQRCGAHASLAEIHDEVVTSWLTMTYGAQADSAPKEPGWSMKDLEALLQKGDGALS
jgi:hypothetical protein